MKIMLKSRDRGRNELLLPDGSRFVLSLNTEKIDKSRGKTSPRECLDAFSQGTVDSPRIEGIL
jgi:hypothetical protein